MTAPGKPEPRKFAANQRMTLKQITGPGKGGACMGVSVVFKRKLLIIQLFQCIWRKGCPVNPLENAHTFGCGKTKPTVSATVCLRLRQAVALPVYTLALVRDLAAFTRGKSSAWAAAGHRLTG
jgi:hypothetical protein